MAAWWPSIAGTTIFSLGLMINSSEGSRSLFWLAFIGLMTNLEILFDLALWVQKYSPKSSLENELNSTIRPLSITVTRPWVRSSGKVASSLYHLISRSDIELASTSRVWFIEDTAAPVPQTKVTTSPTKALMRIALEP